MVRKLLKLQLLAISMFSMNIWAVDCVDIWPGGAQNNNGGGELKFEESAKLINNPTLEVMTNNLVDNSAASCNTASCIELGSIAAVSDHTSFPNGGDVTIGSDTTLSPTAYNSLTVSGGVTLTLNPGDYTFKTDLVIENSVTVVINGSGTVRLLIKKSTSLGDNVSINASGTPSQLLLFGREDISVNKDVSIQGLIYSKKDLSIDEDSSITGAINGKNIVLKKNSTVTYDAASVSSNDFGGFCDSSPASPTLDHFVISHDNFGIHCLDEVMNVAPKDSSGSDVTGYSDTIVLDTQSGDGNWIATNGNGTLLDATPDDGLATYTFSGTEILPVSFTLDYPTGSAVINIDVYESGGPTLRDDDTEGDISFAASGFTVTKSALSNPPPNPINDDISAQIAGKSFTAHIAAFGQTPTDPQCGVIESYDGAQNLNFWMDYVNPTSGTIAASVDGSTIATTEAGSSAQSVSFSSGQASVTVIYNDAGEIQLNMEDETDAPTNTISGASNSFVVTPAGLCIESNDANADCVAGNETCSLFKKAGEIFNLRIKGVAWQTSGESNADFCTGNATTPNFQLTNIALSSNLVAPSPGTNATLGVTSFNMAAADNGLHNITNQSISEVGVFTITATPPPYIGETITTSNSANIGRFYPDRFEVSAGSITEACSTGGFSYLGQDFTGSYTLTAKNTGTGTTTNYRDDFIRLDPSISPPVAAPLNTLSFGAIDNSAPTLLSGRLPLMPTTGFSWNNDGTGSLTSTLSLARLGMGSSNVDGPFTAQIGVLPTDADGVTVQLSDRNLDSNNSAPNDHVLISTSIQRYGRLVIDNAFGPEVLDLKVPLRTEYWNGTAFVINGNDTACSGSLFTTPNFIFTDPVLTDSLTEASLSSKSYSPITSGSGSLTLGAPNTSGPLNISLNVPAWLKYDFNGDGSDENPTGQAFFGQYRGNDRIIFWREQF